MKLERELTIELLEDHEKASFYSPLFKGEKYTEFEKFLLTYKETHPKDIGIMMERLNKIAVDGVFERHFRYAGKRADRTAELPSHLETTKLRLYCICLSSRILILGNGGLKKTRTYNEDPQLNSCVETLLKIDLELNIRQKNYKITVDDRVLSGELTFCITQ